MEGWGEGRWKIFLFKLFSAFLLLEPRIIHAPLVTRLVALGFAQKGLCRIKQPIKLLIVCRGCPGRPLLVPAAFRRAPVPPRGTETNYSSLTNLLAALPYLEPADTLRSRPGNHPAATPRRMGPPAPALPHHAPKPGRHQRGRECFTPPACLGQPEQAQTGRGKAEKPVGQGRSTCIQLKAPSFHS